MLRMMFVFSLCTMTNFGTVQISDESVFTRICGASAGVALDGNIFVAADDESNRLRIYARNLPGTPISQFETSGFLQIGKGNPEIDAEGAAQVGDVIYWITSHARNRDGEVRPNRQRFFATKISGKDQPRLEFIGKPYANLLRHLVADPQFAQFDLEKASTKAPDKKNALNIEGLAARADGSLLIAFRNPVPGKKALLIPLLNPAELVQDGNARAKFGPAIQVSLDENGVRDIVQRDGKFYIIAGARDGGKDTQFYEWDGTSAPKLLHQWQPRTFNPEAILSIPGRPDEFLVLSDDGSVETNGKECGDLPEASRKFRAVTLKIQR